MNKFLKWKELSDELKALKAKEMKMRRELCNELLLGKALPSKLTKRIDGFEIIAENGVSHKLDDTVVNQIFDELSDEEKNALKFKPELRLADYKKLPDDSLLHEAVTVKPSAPTLKVQPV